MALRLSLVRHGETQANLDRQCDGQRGGALTADGRAQACLLGKRFGVEEGDGGLDVDRIICSDLDRCQQTLALAIFSQGLVALPPRLPPHPLQ